MGPVCRQAEGWLKRKAQSAGQGRSTSEQADGSQKVLKKKGIFLFREQVMSTFATYLIEEARGGSKPWAGRAPFFL